MTLFKTNLNGTSVHFTDATLRRGVHYKQYKDLWWCTLEAKRGCLKVPFTEPLHELPSSHSANHGHEGFPGEDP